ncbi:MAG: hypothetical protein FJZ00_09280 [Candidatus Sericytochromatia bacterium]|uniref:Uncharacterized protein n=1 Tax=Candidatus Tanganyikabacteria bacterium TaxID=2961651 RepID=A0A937X3S9_9BACT|nr:hypothetical protein [Candidatus Tanganyikabacteria bacterium]
MYLLQIKGKAIEVSDWSHGIKLARRYHRGVNYAHTSAGDFEFCELGHGKVGIPVLRPAGKKTPRARAVGMVIKVS